MKTITKTEKRVQLSAEARCALITRVLGKAHDETETWYEDGFGAQLAYWALAVADGKHDSFVDWSDDVCGMEGIRAAFRGWFAASDDCWAFIWTGGKEGVE